MFDLRTMMIAAAASAAVGFGAQAAVVSPVSGELMKGAVTLPGFPGRDDVTAAFGPADGDFVSLGLGGVAVFDFGAKVTGTISTTEVTTVCDVSGIFCDNHKESAKVFVSTSYAPGSFDLTGFTEIGELGNGDASLGSVLAAGVFRYVAFLDTTPGGSSSFDGFDIDELTADVTPVPLPFSAGLLACALAGVAVLRRRAA